MFGGKLTICGLDHFAPEPFNYDEYHSNITEIIRFGSLHF